MRRISILFITLIMAASAEDLYSQGKRIFAERCSSCHGSYIDPATIKKNFFEMNNTLLHLKAPTVNMLVYAITNGPKKVGEPNDGTFRVDEVAAYLQEYLLHPDRHESVFSPSILRFFDRKKPIRGLDESDYEALAVYLLTYPEREGPSHRAISSNHSPILHNVMDESQLLERAKTEHKILLVEATSPYCHYCKKMERYVFPDPKIATILQARFLVDKIDIGQSPLPFGLEKVYRHITPSFFFLDGEGKLISHYPGSWTRHDFLQILQEVIQKSKESSNDSRR